MKIAKLILLNFAILLLVACGGSSEPLTREGPNTDEGGDSPDSTPVISLSLDIVDSQGSSATQLAEGSPLTLNATVTDDAGVAQAGLVVTFTLSTTQLATFSTDTGTALTNEQGVATMIMTVGDLSGSGTVTASVPNATPVEKGFESMGTQQQTPFTLELYANAVQLASSGGDQIELIAVVKNEQNILLPSVSVAFSADQDASLSNIDLQTGDDGTARAMLTTQNNKENRQISVVANTATLSQSLNIDVVGTEVNLNGASSVIINDSAPITIVLSDSDGNGISNEQVQLTTDIGQLDNNAPITGQNGQVTVNFSSPVSGTATVTASALNANATFNIVVQQDDFSFFNIPTENLALSTQHAIDLRWFKNNAAFANGTVEVTTSRGIISVNGIESNTTVTNAQGIASVTISSDFAGPATVSAIGVDSEGNQVSARAVVEFVASTVDKIFVDATPDLIGPEGQTSTITAILRDDRGNLVKGKVVNFRLISDASGGSVSPNTAITDSNGIASTVYTSNAVSGDNGVTIGAESDGIESTTDLTVGDRAFDISLGTGNAIINEDGVTYIKEFAVFVTDSSGRPVANAELTASVVPTQADAYSKGYWVWNEDDNVYFAVVSVVDAFGNALACPNEDVNQDGILERSEDTNQNGVLDEGEDLNNNGLLDLNEDNNNDGLLTPGNTATVNFRNNVSRTDEFGQAIVQLRYAKQFAYWSKVTLSVFGQSAGTESMEAQNFSLSIAADDLTTRANPPPSNPFGSSTTCADNL
ncbi:Ig-like domain-containing protein [Glaciecola petra]|uniref:Ig-like domain-containing protein n=1 Tax=Glaciecola petra TaxID=3075602 RepID=A0ABU2ZNK1_9ALTE|nr:Ig-like domain-containing protein [Aestuariibacter sp. P117]MDT0594207.1 Ig-like domain-containing protein [Aestuariibacter sp. P117]